MKILYLMHIDWNWIKQRPHFMAEKLDSIDGVDLQLCYRPAYNKQLLSQNKNTLHNSSVLLPKIPFSSKSVIITAINGVLEYFKLRKLINQYDIIYITHPTFLSVAQHAKGKIIIYDCMDDIVEFKLPDRIKRLYAKYERKLISLSSLVLYTAEHLKKVVERRYNLSNTTSAVINNALNIPTAGQPANKDMIDRMFIEEDGYKTISYIGTVSQWFDYNSLISVVKQNPNVRFFIFGPCECSFPTHPQIVFHGAVKHNDVFYIMEKSDALIMPFVINNLILSVNPVKLYEYIYSTKPVLSIKYPETEKFGQFVYLYSNTEELAFTIDTLQANGFKAKCGKAEATEYVKSNTWQCRAKQLIDLIKTLQ